MALLSYLLLDEIKLQMMSTAFFYKKHKKIKKMLAIMKSL